MAITTVFSFDNKDNFSLSNTQIDNNVATLGFVPNPNQVFSEDFSSDEGFNYDSDLSEFDKSEYHTGKYSLTIKKNGVLFDKFKNSSIQFTVPDQSEVNITELISF